MEFPNDLNYEQQILELYVKLLGCWNTSNAAGFAGLFLKNGSVIGFDGSQMNGQLNILEEISRIFSDHKVASYVSIVQEIRPLSQTVFVLTSHVGMVTPGKADINPKVNAIQTMIAKKEHNRFRIAVFQNTPLALHENPKLKEEISGKLQETYNKLNVVNP